MCFSSQWQDASFHAGGGFAKHLEWHDAYMPGECQDAIRRRAMGPMIS